MAKTITIEPIRDLPTMTLGVREDADTGSWFVWARPLNSEWGRHCGPYSTRDQAVGWITAIAPTPLEGQTDNG